MPIHFLVTLLNQNKVSNSLKKINAAIVHIVGNVDKLTKGCSIWHTNELCA